QGPAQLKPTHVDDGKAAAYSRQIALMPVMEGRDLVLPLQALADKPGDILTRLLRSRRKTGDRLAIEPVRGRGVADHENVAMTR
ncbi:hypothetical protein, partial [Salmonella enterica]|uniref:hypothetical protein n=1 Tax=Salmonella enterica TaxID=28901 RepID=UPI003CE7AE77